MPTALPSSDAALEARVFWLRYQKAIASALIAIVLGMAGFTGYRFYVNRHNAIAAESLGKAKTAADYQDVIAKYPNTPAGASAYLLLADSQRNEGKFEEANATLRAFLDKNPKHELAPTAQLAIASNLEKTGKPDEALAIYQQIAAKYPTNFNAPLALVSEVPLLKAKNNVEEARRICEEVLTKYRMPGQQAAPGDDRLESVWAMEAMRYLRALKPPEQQPTRAAPPSAPRLLARPSAPPATAPLLPAGAPTPKKPK